jgi:hypothetical protein
MGQLTWVLAGMLRYAARLLPPGRRQWAEAVGAEAGQVPLGWPRLRWLAGGLWLVVREAKMARKVVYWLGAGAVAAAAGWVVWLSWRTSPAADSQAVTDRVRVLVGAAALVVLPWVGRRRGWFGPSVAASRRGWCGGGRRRSAAWAWPSRMDSHLARACMARARPACPARSRSLLALRWQSTWSRPDGPMPIPACCGSLPRLPLCSCFCRAAASARGRHGP